MIRNRTAWSSFSRTEKVMSMAHHLPHLGEVARSLRERAAKPFRSEPPEEHLYALVASRIASMPGIGERDKDLMYVYLRKLVHDRSAEPPSALSPELANVVRTRLSYERSVD